MLFHTTFKPKANYGHQEQKKTLELWSKWQPPQGFQIRAFYFAVDGRGFTIVEAQTAEAMLEVTALWARVYLDYEIVPIVDLDQALPRIQKAIAARE